MILLDTHAVLWLAETPHLLSPRAHEAIRVARQSDGLAVSDKTLWELAMLIDRERATIKTSLRDFLQTVEIYFTILPITAAIAEQSMRFSDQYSKDPADQIIGATALVHGLQLVTRDQQIRNSGEVPCLW